MSDPLAYAAISKAEASLIHARQYMGATNPRALAKNYVRRLIAEINGISYEDAKKRWGDAGLDIVTKAPVSAITLSEVDADAQGILGLVSERSVIGRLANLRRIPFHTRMTKITSGALAHWVAEGNPRPMSRPALDGDTLVHRTLSVLIALTKEGFFNPAAEGATTEDLVRALVDALDERFTSDSAGVSGASPDGIAVGAASIQSTGNIANDIEALLEIFTGDLLSTSIITTPSVAIKLALSSGGNSQVNLGINGGDLFGIPVLTTRNISGDSNGNRLLLVDASGIIANVDGIQVSRTGEATLAMADDPSSPAQMVSLFQTNTVALMGQIVANWNVSRAGSVAVLEGI